MTGVAGRAEVGSRRRLPIVDAEAPAERLAAFRILLGAFVTGYLLVRFPVFTALGDRDAADFEPVGVLAILDGPPSGVLVSLVLVLTVLAGSATTLGWRFRVAGPVLAVGMLLLATARSSWGQMLHFEHLIVLHLLVLAVGPAADAWSLDARRIDRSGGRELGRPATAYGWPLALAALVTVVTYVVAGVAKLRYGGIDWVSGDTLRNHIAYAATRAELLGGEPAPLAGVAVRHPGVLGPLAAASVVLELAAPVALLGGRWRNVWVAAVWLMHLGILATMWIGFPMPLFGIAFAPMFAIEGPVGGVGRTVTGWARRWGDRFRRSGRGAGAPARRGG